MSNVKIPIGFTEVPIGTKDRSNTTIAILREKLNKAYTTKQGIPIKLNAMLTDMVSGTETVSTKACIDTYIPRLVKSGTVVLLKKDNKKYILPLRLTTDTDHILPKTKQAIKVKVVQDAITAGNKQFVVDQKVKADNASIKN